MIDLDYVWTAARREVLAHEGGYVNDPADPGGATKYGVSLRWLRSLGEAGDIDGDGDVDAADIQALTVDQAGDLFYERFWLPLQAAKMPAAIGIKAFDGAVNVGQRQMSLLLQRALCCCRYRVTEDGAVGPQTLAAVNGARPEILLPAICATQEGFYRALVAADPVRQKYLAGWVTRARWTPVI